jgi:hypothetical protein
VYVGAVGSTNSFNYVGVSQSSLSTATIVGAFDWNTGTDPFFTFADNFSFVLDGNWTSFTWSTVYAGGAGFNRTDAAVPAGSYNGFYGTTTWTWFNSGTYSTASNFQIELVL